MKKSSFLFACFFLLHVLAHAQSVQGGSSTSWTLQTVGSSTPFNAMTDYETKRSVLYISESEAIIAYNEPTGGQQIVFSDIRDPKGIAKVNSNGQVKWKTPPSMGSILDIALVGNDVLVISGSGATEKSVIIKNLKLTLLNAATGKKLLEKDFPTSATKFSEIILHKSLTGNFQQLLIRNTLWPGNRGLSISKYAKEARTTESLKVYAIEKDLTLKEVSSILPSSDQQFLGSLTDNKGNLNILWGKTGSLVLEQFSPGSSKPSLTINTAFNWLERSQPVSIVTENNGLIVSTLQYNNGTERVIKTAIFDPAAQKASSYDEFFNNDYRNAVEAQAEIPAGRDKDLKKRHFGEMEISDVHFYNDNIILVKEARGLHSPGPQARPRSFSSDVLITIVDKNGKLLKHFVINKYVENFIISMSLGTRVSGDQLQVLAIDNTGIANFTALYGTIDLKSMKWNSVQPLKEGAGILKTKSTPHPANTLWFAKNPVLHFLEQKAWGGAALITELKVLKQ